MSFQVLRIENKSVFLTVSRLLRREHLRRDFCAATYAPGDFCAATLAPRLLRRATYAPRHLRRHNFKKIYLQSDLIIVYSLKNGVQELKEFQEVQ